MYLAASSFRQGNYTTRCLLVAEKPANILSPKGPLISPSWGSTCPPSPRRRGKTDYARRRTKTVFSFSEGRRWTATGVLTSRRGLDEGSLPERPRRQYRNSFILLHTSADKRSGGVSGALRGGQRRETGLGTQPVHSSLSTRHLSLSSSRAAAGLRGFRHHSHAIS